MLKYSLGLAASLLAATPAVAGNAQGTPQRSSELPPGLQKKVTDPPLGILNAIARTAGANSRLQDLPASP